MSDEIRPALTAEEWNAGWTVVFGVEGEGDEVAAVIRNRHGMAARCLHGQSFGLTREDVEWVRDHAGCNCGENECPPPPNNLANRIEALLPPEEH